MSVLGMEMTLVKSLHNFLKAILVDDVRSMEGFLSVQIPEPVFFNVYGAQESISRNEFRHPM